MSVEGNKVGSQQVLSDNIVEQENLEIDEQELLDTLRQTILPQLKQKIVGMRFPDVDVSGEKHTYALQQMILSRVSFPPEKAKIHENNGYQLTCNDIKLYVDIGLWKYETYSNWKWADQGSAVAILSKVTILLSLQFWLEPDTGIPQVKLLLCQVTVGKVKLRFEDTASKWLYNIAAFFFHSQLKKITAKALEQYTRQVMEEQLHIWSRRIFGIV
eukprot:jgi/Galph1/3502/GphlegSOOS_G2128.1